MIAAGYKSTSTSAKGYQAPPGVGLAMPHLPETFSLDEDDLKDIKGWKVGKTYDLSMTVKMTGQRQDTADKTIRASFEIVDVQVDDGTDSSDDN